MYYDYIKELSIETRKQATRRNKKGTIVSDQMWRNDSYGSASCTSCSMSQILDSYNEYKSYEY